MAIKYDNVIVFGPTGQVGSAAALEASKRGAKVWLAMRDTNKAIDGLTDEQEKNGKFARVKADLSDPDTVKEAVRLSGAKAAYLYLVFTPAGMKGALQAMKEAGIEYVVFLSTFTIKKNSNIREIPPEATIPYGHAQVEIALEDLGLAHTALRPAAFASNVFKMSMDFSKTPHEVYLPDGGERIVDNIVPEDIGRVGGAVLVDRPSTSSKEIVYLLGPTLINELELCNIIAEHYPKKVKVVPQTTDEWAEGMRAKGYPPPIVNYLLKARKDTELYTGGIVEEGVANIKKYSGYEPTSFEDFVKSEGARLN